MNIAQLVVPMQEKANKTDAIGSTLKFDFGDQQLYIDGRGEKNEISQNNDPADCVISISQEHFEKLLKGELNPMTAVMTGKIKIKGDMTIALKLKSLLG